MRRLAVVLFLIVALFAAILPAGCGFDFIYVSDEFRQTVAAAPGTTLEVFNRNGGVEIALWDHDSVEIYALKKSHSGRGELEKVNIKVNTGGKIVIESEYLRRTARVSVDYVIKVPAGVLVTRAQTSNGSISIDGVSGDLTAQTSNGKIEINGVNGNVAAMTSNGKIRITGTAGIRQAGTSNGDIFVEIAALKEDLNLTTSNGSITVYLSPGLGAAVDARTSNGKISIHELTLTVTESSGTALKGRIGEGGPRLSLKTSNGSIKIYSLD